MQGWEKLPEHLKGRVTKTISTIQEFQKAVAAAEKAGIEDLETISTPDPFKRVIISIDRLLPGLNGKDGLIRQNHFNATKVKSGLLALVKSGQHGTFGTGMVKIICTRYYCGTAMDFDNASASFKYLVDAIVKAGIIQDDSPKTIEEWTVRQIRVENRRLQKMEVEIILFT